MSVNYYRKGRSYELFIKKVFNCKSGKRYGADESLMIQLFINEKNIKGCTLNNRQFFKVKLYIERALIKLKKKKKYIDSYNHFSQVFNKLKEAATADDLMKIVDVSFIKIAEIENLQKKSVYI